MSTTNYPVPPPEYTNNPSQASAGERSEDPLLTPDGGVPRTADDSVPDDFIKYTGFVSGANISIRNAFIRKVYTILTAQLLATVAIGAVISLNPSVKMWALSNLWAFYVSLFGSIGLMIGAFVTRRSYPTNLFFLAGFTLLESYAIGTISSIYDTRIVVEAVAITFVIFFGLSLFALQSKYDFTSWQGVLSAGLWGLIGVGLITIFIPFSSTAELIYSVIGAVIFSGYILVDTQLILNRYHPEDEIPAAISLYLDIINLFLNILRILNATNDN